MFDEKVSLAGEGLTLDDKANKFLNALLVFGYAGQGDFNGARSHRRKCDVWSSTLEELGSLYSDNGRSCTDDFRNGVARRYVQIAQASRRRATLPGGADDQSGRTSAESAGSDGGSGADSGSGPSDHGED